MASAMDCSPSIASAPGTDLASGGRPDKQSGAASGVAKASRAGAGAGARKPAKVSKTKAPDGSNSDHRKEQNRIASRNYRKS